LISNVSQRVNEKNLIIYNLQENFNRERNTMLHKISTLKWKLSVEEEKVKTAAREREIDKGGEGGDVCRDVGAETTKPQVGPEQVEECKSKSLEAERHSVQHQALEPNAHQKDLVKVLAQRRSKKAVSQSPQAGETESWQSARETVSPSVEFVPQQGQGQERRKRKRGLRGGDCS
jgi:hypothetical protein